MEKREKKFLIAGIIFSVIMIVFSYVAITSDNGEKAEISKGSVQYQETKSQISIGETINIVGILKMVRKMEKVSILTRMVLHIKVHSKIVVSKMVNLH